MTGEDNIRTIAEVAVAFTGFSSIVAVFQRHSRVLWHSVLVVSLGVMVTQLLNSLGVVFSQSYSGYFIGLLSLLVLAAVTFARLLHLAFRAEIASMGRPTRRCS